MSIKSLHVVNLKKDFCNSIVVNNLSFHVNQGDIYGFLGPNGSGKSTTLKIILGLVKASSGNVFFDEKITKNNKHLSKIGAFIERADFYKNLTAYQNLTLLFKFSKLKNIAIIENVLSKVGLLQNKNQKFQTFSQGMKQRLGIAQALMNKPNLLILDEPTNGLDPKGQKDIRDLILKLNKEENITIVISSHILSDIEKICNRMIVINKGEKILEGEVSKIISSGDLKISIKPKNIKKLQRLLLEKKISFKRFEKKIILPVQEKDIPSLIHEISKKEIEVFEIKQLKTLEDLFINLTQ